MSEKKSSLAISVAKRMSEIEQDPEFKKALKHFYEKIKEFNDKYRRKGLRIVYGEIQDYFAGYIMEGTSLENDPEYFFEEVRDLGGFKDSTLRLVNEYVNLKQDAGEFLMSPDDPLLK